jgi:hypothetical protein
MALEVDGFNHLIENNTIGVDSAGTEVGVCGIGLNVSGDEIEVLSNAFVNTRKGFEEESSDTAVYVSVSETSGGEITIRYNIIKDGPNRAIEFTNATPNELALFQPAQLVINGTTVTGSNGVNSPCPGCDVDLYLDDTDDKEEALEYLGTVTADANGDFVVTLPAELEDGFGIRTGSTTNSSGVIGSLGAGASSQLSELYLPAAAPNEIAITGPTAASVGTAVEFTLTVAPTNATTPLTYLVEATDLAPIEETLETTSATLTLSWDQPGAKTIDVTVSNALGSATEQYVVEVTADGSFIYLPTVVSN